MIDPVWHPRTTTILHKLAQHPTHALILSGPVGSGKKETAMWLCRNWLSIETQPTADQLLYLEPVNKQVTIEQIREVQQFAKLKHGNTIARIIIIDHADTMAEPAQNALLKILEEPVPGTVIILLAQHTGNLRPTILSRCQQVRLLPLPMSEFNKHFPDLDTAAISRVYSLSGGYVNVAHQRLDKDLAGIDTAKNFIAKSKYERAISTEQYNKDRDAALELVQNLLVLCRSAMHQTLKQGNQAYRQWQDRMNACLTAHRRLIGNANIKLVLDSLALELI